MHDADGVDCFQHAEELDGEEHSEDFVESFAGGFAGFDALFAGPVDEVEEGALGVVVEDEEGFVGEHMQFLCGDYGGEEVWLGGG